MKNFLNASDDKNIALRSLKAGTWFFLFKFMQQFIQLLIGVCLARLLSPADYGVLGVLTIFWAISSYFIQCGMGNALQQKKEISQTDVSSIFYYQIFMSLFLCALMILIAPKVALFFKQPILSKTILVSAWNLPIGALSTIPIVLLSRNLKQRVISVSTTIASLIGGVLAIFLAWQGYGVWALVWQTFASTLCASIFVILYVGWFPSPYFSFSTFKPLFVFGAKVAIVGLIDTFFKNINKVFIGKYCRIEVLGYFERASNYVSILPLSIEGTIESILFPSFSKLQDDISRLRNGFKRALSISSFASIFPAFLLCFLSKPFIEVVLTPKWLPCIPFWWLITCCVIFWPIQRLNQDLLIAMGRVNIYVKVEIFKKLFSLLAIVVLLILGVIPMLIFEIFLNIIFCGINSCYAAKFLDYSLAEQIGDNVIYIIFTVLVCSFAWFIYYIIFPFSHCAGLIIPLFFGGGAYFLLNRLFKTDAFVDLGRIIGAKNRLIGKLFGV